MPKKEITFNAGDVLFKKGDACTFVYTVLDGAAEQFYEINGKIRPLKEEGVGAVLGKNGALEGVYDTSVRAKRRLRVACLTKEEYIAELQKTGEMTPTTEAGGAEPENFEDGDPFDFNFDMDSFSESEEKPKKTPLRPTAGQTRKTDVTAFNADDFSFETRERKNELVKVERTPKNKVPVVLKPEIVVVSEKKSGLKEWLNEAKQEPVAYGTCFLLAAVEGDEEGAVREAVFAALNKMPDVRVKVTDKPVTETNPRRAVLQMRSWMKKAEADAGLYARFDAAGRVLEFHGVRVQNPHETAENASSGMRFFLPVAMKAEHEALLRAFAVCALEPLRLEHEQLLRLYLPEALKDSFDTGSAPLVGLNAEEQSANLCCFADALSLAAFYAPHFEPKIRARAVYEKALTLMPPHAPEYVFLNRQLGLMNQIEGEKSDDIDAFKQAETLFDNASKAVSAARFPAQWGDLKAKIGAVRLSVAVNTGKGEDFTAAVGAYRDALSALKPQTDIEKWADAMNGLARSIQLFGMYSTKTTLLKRAVKIYEKELDILNRDSFPHQWAAASNNLASALFSLFDKEHDASALKRAVEVFADALATYDKIGSAKKAVVAEVNLNKAKKMLTAMEKELETKENWLDDLLDETQNSENGGLHFEKIAVFEELDDEEE